MNEPRSVAIVHDWLVGMRGGEKVLEVLCELFPDATLWTLVYRKGSVSPTIERMSVRTSVLQRLPFGTSAYKSYLPLFPTAMKSIDVRGCDLVISVSHAAAKAVRADPGALHICYCHTPMRYIWDQYDDYFGPGRASLLKRGAIKMFLGYLRRWDVRTAQGVNHFIANSKNVQERIKRIYDRESAVIYPPVDAGRFSVSGQDKGYYLIVSALVPYKRVDLAVEVFNALGDRLIIVGSGDEGERLEASARKNIEFTGWVGDEALAEYYAGCRALIFPGVEDFGIVPLEAMASGKPVIAYGKGGVLETVVDGVTGVLFPAQTPDKLKEALRRFTRQTFDASRIRDHAMKFDRRLFKKTLEEHIRGLWEGHVSGKTPLP